MTATRSRRDSSRMPGLDGLRAAAILLVILWHSAFVCGGQAPPSPLARLAGWGWLGVDLFFALSGFLITHLLLSEERTNLGEKGVSVFSLRLFYLRRALRILPAFYAVFLLNVLVFRRSSVVTSASWSLGPKQLLAATTFWLNYLMGYGDPSSPGQAYIVYWSLCVEEHFYLLWPLVLHWVRRPRTRIMVGATTCLALCTLRWLAVAWHFDTHANLHFVSHYRIDSILWGALGALTFAELRRRPAWRRCALLFSSIASVAALWTRNPSQPTPLQASVGLSAAALTATLLVVEVAATPRSVFTRLLDWLPLRSLGRVSYGMYLLHFQMMDVAFPLPFLLAGEYGRTSLMLSFLVFSATTWVAAEGLYRVLERPILTRRERWLRRVGR